jgi:hypothetical protein
VLLLTIDLLIPESYIGVNNFLIPKCMSKQMGRPPLPKGQAKGIQIGVRLAPKDAKKIREAILASGENQAEWARRALCNAARPIWVLSKNWTADDLHRKSVEFDFRVPHTKEFTQGQGTFYVIKHRDKVRLAIQIRAGNFMFLPQEVVDAIERHPNAPVVDFRCQANVTSFALSGLP